MSARLISNYGRIVDFGLHEAGNYPHPKTSPYATYSHEYYVEYVTMCAASKLHAGLRSTWNCSASRDGHTDYQRNGFPISDNLAMWAMRHERIAHTRGIELIVVSASIRRSSTGAVVAKWHL
jgi:hypothetical protein